MIYKNADGVSGSLLYVYGRNKYVFRVYDDAGDFIDYTLKHCDLSVTINDPDACFYEDENKLTLDHSPETLGLI